MNLSILVVDDHPDNTEIMGYMLKMFGHRSTSVYDGESALAALKTSRFDLVITDDRMSGMSGFDLAAAIRADETIHQMPILLVSAYEYDDTLPQRMAASGIDGFLPRPWTPEKLQAAIESLVKRPSDA
ncbi:response regulator [Aggregatilineales bacterium SYSU G02658]